MKKTILLTAFSTLLLNCGQNEELSSKIVELQKRNAELESQISSNSDHIDSLDKKIEKDAIWLQERKGIIQKSLNKYSDGLKYGNLTLVESIAALNELDEYYSNLDIDAQIGSSKYSAEVIIKNLDKKDSLHVRRDYRFRNGTSEMFNGQNQFKEVSYRDSLGNGFKVGYYGNSDIVNLVVLESIRFGKVHVFRDTSFYKDISKKEIAAMESTANFYRKVQENYKANFHPVYNVLFSNITGVPSSHKEISE